MDKYRTAASVSSIEFSEGKEKPKPVGEKRILGMGEGGYNIPRTLKKEETKKKK